MTAFLLACTHVAEALVDNIAACDMPREKQLSSLLDKALEVCCSSSGNVAQLS